MQKFTLATTNDRLTSAASSWLEEALFDGAFAIDCTIGNGYDTLFLAHRVGPNGKVLGFDVQETAIASTREMLKFAGLMDRVSLILDCHSQLEKYLPARTIIYGAMFNLGYLPRGSREIITHSQTTIPAVAAVIRHLTPGGRLTVLAYRGHPGGLTEYGHLQAFFSKIPPHEYTVEECTNTIDSPVAPRLFRVQNLRGTSSVFPP